MKRIWAGIAAVWMSVAPASGELPAPVVKDGVDCERMQTDRPPVQREQVEVLEAFSYGCRHCFDMEPFLTQWLKTKPAHTRFVRLHVPGRGANAAFARLFYTLKSMGRLDLHEAIFSSVFNQARSLSDMDETKAFKLQLAFVTEHSVDPDLFTETYHSKVIADEIQQVRELLQSYGLDRTPLFFVNGQYRVSMAKINHEPDVLSVIDTLATQLK